MRKILAFMLLAGAAVPAIAAGDPGDHTRRDRDGEQAEQHQQRSERAIRSDNGERPHFDMSRSDNSPRVEQPAPAAHFERNNNNDGTNGQRNFERFRQVQAEGGYQPNNEPAEVRHERIRERQRAADGQVFRHDNDGPRVITPGDTQMGELRQHDRALPNVLRTRTPVVSQVPREGTQPPLRQVVTRHGTHWRTEWRSSWRNDHRYDWRDWRNRHRSIFRLGLYYDPFGWNYQPYSIGWRLWPRYYSSSFWINDPWQYRLPYAPPGTRWIRYYNDAILVDSFTGEVVDVIYNFFW